MNGVDTGASESDAWGGNGGKEKQGEKEMEMKREEREKNGIVSRNCKGLLITTGKYKGKMNDKEEVNMKNAEIERKERGTEHESNME